MSRSWVERHARLLGFCVFVVISFAWFAKVWADPVHRHAGVAGDPDAYIAALAWPPFAIAHHMNPFYSVYLAAPKGANLMWTIPPGFGVLLAPLTVTIGVVPTYNLLATLSLAFSAWTAQLALRRFAPGELGPFVGGLFYGFSPYMAAHSLGHVMLTVAILPPLLLLLLHEALIRQRWWPWVTGLAAGALLALQLSTFLEMIAGAAVAAGLLVVLLAAVYRKQIRDRWKYVLVTSGSAVLTLLVLGGIQLQTLLFGSRNLFGVRALLHPKNVFVTDFWGFVVPTAQNAIAPAPLQHFASHFGAVTAELNGYIGLPLLIVVVVIAVRNWSSTMVRIATVWTGIMALLSMGPRLQFDGTSTIPLPWDPIGRLPLMENLLPVRLSVFTDLGIAVLLAYAIGHRVRQPDRKRTALRTVAVVAVVATLLPSRALLNQLSTPVAVPSYFTSSELKRIPKGSIAARRAVDDRSEQRPAGGVAGVRALPLQARFRLRVPPAREERRQQRASHRLARGVAPADLPRAARAESRRPGRVRRAAPPRAPAPHLHCDRRTDAERRRDGAVHDRPARSRAGGFGRRVRLVRRRAPRGGGRRTARGLSAATAGRSSRAAVRASLSGSGRTTTARSRGCRGRRGTSCGSR